MAEPLQPTWPDAADARPPGDTRQIRFGAGSVVIAGDGSVASVTHPDGRSMLLREPGPGSEQPIDARMHTAARRWGKGFLIADGRGYRFDAPSGLAWHPDGVTAEYEVGPLVLRVTRSIGDTWQETYEFENLAGEAVRIGSLAISTPWRDGYQSSHDSLTGAVHAHVWTGGADAWTWAVPMDGTVPGLGLQLTEGELWAYSVESRDQGTSSNVRGHLYLHMTDHHRAPHTFGGQPELTLPPGGSYRLAWTLGWHESLAGFHAQRRPFAHVPRVSAEVGTPIVIEPAAGVTTQTPLPLVADPGLHYIDLTSEDGRRARVACLVTPPLREIAERRAEFLLERQRPHERADSSRFAFVPYDNESGLTVLADSWSDWSEGDERIGSALLLQQLLRLGWGDRDRLREALHGYQRFVVDHLVDADGTVHDTRNPEHPRLYNFPWFARFLLDAGNLDLAARVMTRFYELGGSHFLAFELGSVVGDVAAHLRDAGRHDEAAALTARLLEQADTYVGYGTDLPAHEVNYEQSIVAPLLDLLLAAERLDPGRIPPHELRRRLRWLQAFAADQPDARVRHMPIRHWDGYWFGRRRLWGDVFPHYWSILNAGAYLAWPDGLLPEDDARALRDQAEAILRGNLISFFPDGSATCAFVYPSCVNGQPAHTADPLANDQDWALLYALRYQASWR